MSVRRNVILCLIVLFFHVAAPVKGLQCQNGRKVKVGPATPLNTFNTTSCSNDSNCISVDVEAEKGIISG